MKVMIAIDDSPYSKDVVDSIVRRAWPERTKFKILTVLEPLCVSCNDSGADFSDSLSDVYRRRRQVAERLCEKIAHKIISAVPTANVDYEIREGLPRTEIINAAVEWAADRILVGAHGRDVCPRNLLGSVSRAIAKQAACSVEIVRPKVHHRNLANEGRRSGSNR
jgi:nucleotide-binding universal stress UspA family protein